MMSHRITRLVIAAALLYVVGYELIWNWSICRVYVPEGKSLLVRYKGNLLTKNPPIAEGDFARVDERGRPTEIGILREMLGPGRHFRYDPIHYERELVDDVVIDPGSIGVVNSKLGKNLEGDAFLVDGDVGATTHKGVLRKVLKPGRYRINRYGYEVQIIKADSKDASTRQTKKQGGWVEIPPGFVGVVTHLTSDKSRNIAAGIQNEVLPAGLYVVNPHEEQIDVVAIGFRETTMSSDLVKEDSGRIKLDDNGEPIIRADAQDKGILFPSNDGFSIHLDFTAVWGIMPDQAAKVVALYGAVDQVEKTVILPEIASISRIHGSKLGAVELLVGDSREEFQQQVSEDFRNVLKNKNISLEVGLVRHIYIPAEVRNPIQKANIAGEIKLTRDMEIETARIEAQLEESKSSVQRDEEIVVADTEKQYQEVIALGRKRVQEIAAESDKLTAAIARKTAEIDAQATLLLGEANADVVRLKKEAEAQKFDLSVRAFGNSDAYNQWTFASKLPENMSLNLFYAGEGTFWTDMKTLSDLEAARSLQQTVKSPAIPSKPATTEPNR